MPQERLGAVFFDLYETLVTELHPDLLRSGPTPARCLGVPAETYDLVWKAAHRARMTRAVDYRDVLRQACVEAGVELDPVTCQRIEELHGARLEEKSRPFRQVEPAVLAMLRRLRDKGVRLAVISNCSVEEVAAWPTSVLATFFDTTVFSFEAGHAKPDPAIYLLACERLGVLPTNTAFVGDGGSEELAGAEGVGMTPYAARWFLDRWPPGRRHRDDQGSTRFGQLSTLDDVEHRLVHLRR